MVVGIVLDEMRGKMGVQKAMRMLLIRRVRQRMSMHMSFLVIYMESLGSGRTYVKQILITSITTIINAINTITITVTIT